MIEPVYNRVELLKFEDQLDEVKRLSQELYVKTREYLRVANRYAVENVRSEQYSLPKKHAEDSFKWAQDIHWRGKTLNELIQKLGE